MPHGARSRAPASRTRRRSPGNGYKVCLACYATNERGLRTYARVGFKVEGRRREQVFIEGCCVDDLLMGLLRDELQA